MQQVSKDYISVKKRGRKLTTATFNAGDGSGWSVLNPARKHSEAFSRVLFVKPGFYSANTGFNSLERSEYVPVSILKPDRTRRGWGVSYKRQCADSNSQVCFSFLAEPNIRWTP